MFFFFDIGYNTKVRELSLSNYFSMAKIRDLVMAKALESGFKVSIFDFSSSYCVHFLTNTLEKTPHHV